MHESTDYDIQFKSSAAKEFCNLPQEIKKRIITKIDIFSTKAERFFVT
jgi:hypothetical protein